MALNFNVKFIINETTQTRVIRITDESYGFTYGKGLFSVYYPDGSSRIKTDYSSPDLTSAGSYIDISAVLDTEDNVITGEYRIVYTAINNLDVEQTSVQKIFDFNWIKPENNLVDTSDVIIPEVKFKDNNSYGTIGSFTGSFTRTIFTNFPSTSAVSGQSVTTTSSNELNVVSSFNYYEGVYSPTSTITALYTHSTYSWLTVQYDEVFTKTFNIKKTPTQLELITKINNFRAIIEGYENVNDTQFNTLNYSYERVMSLYTHIITRYETLTKDGSDGQLKELLSILEPYETSYSYQSGPMQPFELTAAVGNSFQISDGSTTDTIQLGDVLSFDFLDSGLSFTISNNIVRLGFDSGYSVPTSTKQGQWDSAYNDKINSVSVSGTSTKTITLTQQDGGTVTTTWSDYSAVTSVFGRTGDVVATSGDYTTTQVTEGTNLYFTDARARGAISLTTTGSSGSSTYNSTSGVLNIPTYTLSGLGGEPAITAGTTSQYWRGDKSWQTLNTTAVSEGTNLYFTDLRARQAISLTTTGSSGASTYNNSTGVLNVPTYTLSGLGGEPTITAGTTSQYWRGDKSWQTLNTTAVTEGTNLYYTTARFDTAFSGKTTTNLTEGTNLYFTSARVRSTDLTGLNITGSALSSSDTIIQAFGKIQNQINGLVGSVIYQGTWNASTNSPSLTSSTGTKGYYYKVSVAGSTNLDGVTDWKIGDWAIYNGSAWEKVDNTDSVSSVNGYSGAVSLVTSDISEGTNLYYTNARVASYLSGAISSVLTSNLTASRALISNASGKIDVSATTSTELGYVSGVTSAIQTQINGKEATITAGTTSQYWRGDKSWQTLNTTAVTEGTNLYYTDARARASISLTTTGSSGSATYSNTTGVLNVPTYTLSGLGGEPTITAGTTSQYWRGDKSWQTLNTTAVTEGTNLYYTDARARASVSLTTTGTSGAATYNSSTGVLNIPQYQAVLTNPITGSLTTNYIPKASGSTTLDNSLIYDNGSGIGIGTTSVTGFSLRVGKNITGATNAIGIYQSGQVQTDVTNAIYGFRNDANVITGFTLSSYFHFSAREETISGTITNQYGFHTSDLSSGSTGNYGFYGNVSSQTGSWNLYMNGTASNYMAGKLGIGSTSLTNANLLVAKTITGSTNSYSILSQGQVENDVTNSASYYYTNASVSSTATLTDLAHYRTYVGTALTAGTVTNQYGFVASSTLVGATNNYGYYGGVPSGTGRWNLYMTGTAQNYLAGNLGVGSETPSGKLEVNTSTGTAYFTRTAGDNGTSAPTLAITTSTTEPRITGYGSSLSFYTAALGGTAAERGRISSIGNWGIGSNIYTDGGPILTISLTNGGSGYTDGTYNDVATTNIDSTGSYALVNVTISGGIVTSVTLSWGGNAYSAGNTIFVSNTLLGGTGSGLIITVDTVDSSKLVIRDTEKPDITLFRSDTAVALNDNLGSIKWENNDATTKASGIYAQLQAYAAGTSGGAGFKFYTRSSTAGSSLTEKVVITSTGNMGVGYTSPQNKIHIDAGTATASYLQFTAGTTSGQGSTDGLHIGIDASANAEIRQRENLPIIFYTNNTEAARINAGSELIVGYGTTDNGAYKLQVNSQIFATNATIATSDERLKENISPMDSTLSLIMNMNARTFTYKQDTIFNFFEDGLSTGFIAQELAQVLDGTPYKDAIVKQTGQYYGVAYEKIIPMLVKAIQELKSELDLLKQ